MKRYWEVFKCMMFHGKWHVLRLVPVDHFGTHRLLQYMTLCRKCDQDILNALDEVSR